jgi:hypothetical protein
MLKRIIVILAITGTTLASKQPGSHSSTLLWQTDFSALPDFAPRLSQSEMLLRPVSLDFLDNSELVMAFDDGGPSQASAEPVHLGFHVDEISAISGTLGRTLRFRTTNDLSTAKRIDGDRFMVSAAGKLTVYSNTFAALKVLDAPVSPSDLSASKNTGGSSPSEDIRESWRMDVAPGDKTILVVHNTSPQNAEMSWLSAADMSLVQVQTTKKWKEFRAADRGALLVDPLNAVFLSPGQQRVVCTKCNGAYLVTDDIVFIDYGDHFDMSELGGKAIMRGKLDVNVQNFARSANSSLIAYVTGAYRGYGLPLRTHFSSVRVDIRVLDWAKREQIANIRMEKPTGSESVGFSQLAIALSPDGRTLAVFDGRKLSGYRIGM